MPRRDDEEENETRTKRKVHPGLIEADNEEVAIVVQPLYCGCPEPYYSLEYYCFQRFMCQATGFGLE
mgnify:CR=1 FL=1